MPTTGNSATSGPRWSASRSTRVGWSSFRAALTTPRRRRRPSRALSPGSGCDQAWTGRPWARAVVARAELAVAGLPVEGLMRPCLAPGGGELSSAYGRRAVVATKVPREPGRTGAEPPRDVGATCGPMPSCSSWGGYGRRRRGHPGPEASADLQSLRRTRRISCGVRPYRREAITT